MRCCHHENRIAEHDCAVCGVWICAACAVADASLGEVLCPGCAKGRQPGGQSPVPEPALSTSAVVHSRRVLAGIAVGVAAAVFAGILWNGPGEPTGADAPGFDDRPEVLVRAFEALESTGLALEAYRAREGRYPDSLDDLVPSLLPNLPKDPYHPDGDSLAYRVDSEGVSSRILYSRGPDRLDQRGLPLDPLTRTGDLLYPVD